MFKNCLNIKVKKKPYLSSLICCSRVLANAMSVSYRAVSAVTSLLLATPKLSLPSSMSRV